mmetsp:Transcript_34059/g.101708  ORF Transcript_34059/g.101708 Transcript_34059/m.101708 type:complete len:252 (+) Transcript_34059:118-873(+)
MLLRTGARAGWQLPRRLSAQERPPHLPHHSPRHGRLPALRPHARRPPIEHACRVEPVLREIDELAGRLDADGAAGRRAGKVGTAVAASAARQLLGARRLEPPNLAAGELQEPRLAVRVPRVRAADGARREDAEAVDGSKGGGHRSLIGGREGLHELWVLLVVCEPEEVARLALQPVHESARVEDFQLAAGWPDELVLHHVVKEGEPSDEAVLSPLAAGCVHSRPGGHDDRVRSHSKASRVHTLALARWQRG